jgi:hypothetical protein
VWGRTEIIKPSASAIVQRATVRFLRPQIVDVSGSEGKNFSHKVPIYRRHFEMAIMEIFVIDTPW